MKRSIRKKIIGYFSLLIAIVMIGQLVFSLFLLKPFVKYTKNNIIEASFYQLKESYSNDLSQLEIIADEMQDKHGIKLIILNSKEVLYTTGFSSRQDFQPPFMADDNSPMPNKDSPKAYDNAKRDDFIPDISTFSTNPTVEITSKGKDEIDEQIRLTGKFDYNDETIYIVMSLPMEAIDTSVALFTKVSIFISAIALIIGIIIAIVLSKNLSSPIRSVEQVAKSLAELDFSSCANENVSTKELASLAKSINTMSSKLKSSIDELQLANEKLKKDIDYQQRIEQMRRQFIANVSHEMKTPLGLLQIYCENLKNNVDGIDKEYYCNVIIEETQNLNSMVMSMLDASSIESGLSKMSFENIDFTLLCQNVIEKFGVMLDDFDFSQNIDSNINISADKKHIEQAMTNYIQNAINHTIKGSKINISLEQKQNFARFVVSNEGKNIATEDLEHLWEPFYKSDKARTRNGKNNVGLGLYIVKTIIENHNGYYGAENTDNGVIFYFEIPIE